jgi:hypothetical protein
MERNESFTPGPWGYMQAPCGFIYAITQPSNACIRVETNNEANARLIAAAPTLLEALIEARDLLELICMIDPSVDPHEGSVGQKVRAAIALATSANLKEPQHGPQ